MATFPKPSWPEGVNVAPKPSRARKVPHAIQDALNDPRPKVLLPTDNRLMSDVAAELGALLSERLYVHNSEIVMLDGDALRSVDVQTFRTLVEQTVVCCRTRTSREGVIKVGATMTVQESCGILKAPRFSGQLRDVKRVNSVRVPVCRAKGRIELLPEGYDPTTQTLTVCAVTYATDEPFESGVRTIEDLYSEFEFADGPRSKAVAVAAGIGLYAAQLVPEGELRPAFTYLKNAEGAGGTTAAACAIVPVVGHLPTGVKPGDDDEMRKVLSTTVREARPVLLLDNVKGKLSSAALEAFLSSPTWSDRLLGTNETVTGANIAHVFATGNGMTFPPDWRRRSLFVELHLGVERAEDREFERPLSVPVLQSMRSQILAAYWALVRNWDERGRPSPTRHHSAFHKWAEIVGGIVEAAGFACPLETATSAIVADEDGAGMRLLTASMVPEKRYAPQELAELCRSLEIFPQLVGESKDSMQAQHRSAFGRMLQRYDDRLVGGIRFIREGQEHRRRYYVAEINPGGPTRLQGKTRSYTQPHGEEGYIQRGKHLVEPCDHAGVEGSSVCARAEAGPSPGSASESGTAHCSPSSDGEAGLTTVEKDPRPGRDGRVSI